MLHARQGLAIEVRHVHFLLAGRVGIEAGLDLTGDGTQLGTLEPATQGVGHACEIRLLEHTLLREGQLEERVFRHAFPIDELIDHVLVDAEGQDIGHHPHGEAQLFRQALQGIDLVELAFGVDLKTCVFGINRIALQTPGLHGNGWGHKYLVFRGPNGCNLKNSHQSIKDEWISSFPRRRE